MSNEQQPMAIPAEIKNWIKANSPLEDPECYHWTEGAKKIYRHLSPEIATLKAERDVYRKALQEVYSEGMFGYINGDVAGTLAKMAKKGLDQYPSPSPKIDKDNG